MTEDPILAFLNKRIEKCNYISVTFDLALIQEEGFWKILFSRIVFDTKKPEGQKTLLDVNNFRIEQFSLSIDEFLKFYEYLKTVDVQKVHVPASFPKISDNMLFNIGTYRLCFIGNFPGNDISFYGRDVARTYHGLDKPIYFVNYYIQGSFIPKSYFNIDLSNCETPQRDVFDAVNYFWKTNFQQHNLSSNNCGIYMPIYDGSIAGIKVKESKFVIRIDYDSSKTKLDEFTVSLIANLETQKYSQKHQLKENKIEVDVGFIPAYATVYLHKTNEKLDQYNYNSGRTASVNEFKEINTKAEEQGFVRINPIFQGRNFTLEENLCFVLMPFQEPYNTIYNNHIKPAVEKSELKILRADNIFSTSAVVEDIWEYINKASFLIADVTGRNPNVFYELGIAHTIGKNVIIIAQNKDDVPFDLKHIRHFTYSNDEDGLQKLESDLDNVIKTLYH